MGAGQLKPGRPRARPLSGAGAFALLCALVFPCACACSGGSGSHSGGAALPEGGGGGGGGGSPEPPVVVDLAGVRAALGKRARVVGTAQNAKLSAAIVGDELLVYCLDHDSWPRDVTGTRIAVVGTLEWTEEFAATTSPNGEISAGTDGGVFVIRHCAPASAP